MTELLLQILLLVYNFFFFAIRCLNSEFFLIMSAIFSTLQEEKKEVYTL